MSPTPASHVPYLVSVHALDSGVGGVLVVVANEPETAAPTSLMVQGQWFEVWFEGKWLATQGKIRGKGWG